MKNQDVYNHYARFDRNAKRFLSASIAFCMFAALYVFGVEQRDPHIYDLTAAEQAQWDAAHPNGD